jgi:hypothetical protein
LDAFQRKQNLVANRLLDKIRVDRSLKDLF